MCLLVLLMLIGLPTAGWLILGGWGIAAGLMLALFMIDPLFQLQRFYRFYIAKRPLAWLRANLGWGKSVSELAARLKLTSDELRTFQPSYRETFIAKRNGGKRRLFVPDGPTKKLQRRILRLLLQKLRAHPSAMGFERGLGIVDNANRHVRQAIVIRLDIVDFFPTTRADRVEGYFRRIGWNREAAALLTRLTTHENGLPQGAPTSPRLSNLVNYYMDVQLSSRVAEKGGIYTRYADDITISYPLDYTRTVQSILSKVKKITKSKGYQLHRGKKKSIRRHHQRQVVTGLVVNGKPQLPRERRRWLRAIKHHLAQGKPATLSAQQVQGWEALEHMIAKGRKLTPDRVFRAADIRKIIKRRQGCHSKSKK